MPTTGSTKKIVYLFGAGATHAELTNLESELIEEMDGLLIKHVSGRVIDKARRNAGYIKGLEMVSSIKGSLNIELLITLIENSKTDNWEFKSQHLKTLVRKDIEKILTTQRTKKFYLHKALLELHKHTEIIAKEKLTGIISLNYDDVLDQAYKKYYGKPNYCFSLENNISVSNNIPLLKLHGSFNWEKMNVRGRERTFEIIPMGASKNYLHVPYSFIWNRALEILIECDILRVVGCSMSQNDIHLIDLLFKAHLEKGESFIIEIIDSDPVGDKIKANYGFFPKIKKLSEIGSPSAGYKQQVPLVPKADNLENPFRSWLESKANSVLKKNIKNTKDLKHLSI